MWKIMRRHWIVLTFTFILLTIASVVWAASQATYNGYKIAKVLVDDREIQGDVPAIIMDGRVLVPLRLVVENMGGSVTWDGTSGMAIIKSRHVLNTLDEVSSKTDTWYKRREILIDRENGIEANTSLTEQDKLERFYDLYLEYEKLLREAVNTIYVDPNNDEATGMLRECVVLLAGDYFRVANIMMYYYISVSGDQEYNKEDAYNAAITASDAVNKFIKAAWPE